MPMRRRGSQDGCILTLGGDVSEAANSLFGRSVQRLEAVLRANFSYSFYFIFKDVAQIRELLFQQF